MKNDNDLADTLHLDLDIADFASAQLEVCARALPRTVKLLP